MPFLQGGCPAAGGLSASAAHPAGQTAAGKRPAGVCPHCKTVLLVDEAEYPELATAVCLAKKDHIVDDFVYASVSPAYLSAMMDTL